MAAKNKTMETYDPKSWKAQELVAPDGRTWTPSSLAEEKNLISAYGYRFANEVAAENEVTSPAEEADPAAQPEEAPASTKRTKAAVSSEETSQ